MSSIFSTTLSIDNRLRQDVVGPIIVHMLISLISLSGSMYIIQHVLRSKKRRNEALTQIMLGMSCMDSLNALHGVTSILQHPNTDTIGFGTRLSCTTLGFFGIGSSLSSMLYNGALAHYFYLTICSRNGKWSEDRLKRSSLVLCWHLIPLLVGWILAIVGLPFTLYNEHVLKCKIRSYPARCNSYTDLSCERGEHAFAGNIVYHVIFLAVFVWLLISMTCIYRSVSKTERTINKYRINSLQKQYSVQKVKASRSLQLQKLSSTTTMRREIAMQAFLFCVPFFVTTIFTMVGGFEQILGKKLSLTMIYFEAIFSALPGFWNALVYLRPRYLQHRRKQLQDNQKQQRKAPSDNYDGVNYDDDDNYEDDDNDNDPRPPSRFDAFRLAVSVEEIDDGHDDSEVYSGYDNDNENDKQKKENDNGNGNDVTNSEIEDRITSSDLFTRTSNYDDADDDEANTEEVDMQTITENDIELGTSKEGQAIE